MMWREIVTSSVSATKLILQFFDGLLVLAGSRSSERVLERMSLQKNLNIYRDSLSGSQRYMPKRKKAWAQAGKGVDLQQYKLLHQGDLLPCDLNWAKSIKNNRITGQLPVRNFLLTNTQMIQHYKNVACSSTFLQHFILPCMYLT